jgi:parvulin-like peptidyl-prolyl isomerase
MLGTRHIVVTLALGAAACGRCAGGGAAIAARYDGGVVTAEDVQREASRLPPILRTRFETDAGRREMIEALVDKRLLAGEARRRKLDGDPEIRRQVEELEERLEIQALLAAEEKTLPAPTDAELRAWYEGRRAELGEPERARVRRVLAAHAPGTSQADREKARARAERFAARLRSGEPFEKVAREGDGPERTSGGDLGLIAKGEGKDPAQEAAVFALAQPGSRSQVIAVANGFAVLELVERRAGRVPSFEEARGQIANRMEPGRKRKAFDELLGRLRKGAEVRIELQGSR